MNHHNVDEDMMTILAHGGNWVSVDNAGIMYRTMTRSPSEDVSIVASSNTRNVKLYGFPRCRRRQGDYVQLWWGVC